MIKLQTISLLKNKTQIFILIMTALVFLISLYFRVMSLSDFSFWQDELAVYYHITESFDRLIRYTVNFSYHPPLFYLTLKPFYLLFGTSEMAIRSIYVSFGIICSFLPVLLKFRNLKQRLILSSLIICNMNLIIWSAEALTYSLTFLLGTLFTILLDRFNSEKSFQNYLLLSITLILFRYYPEVYKANAN